MVDREARDKLAELARQFWSGRMTNEEFERTWGWPSLSRDEGVRAVEWAVWGTYDDFREERFTKRSELSHEDRRSLAQMILFLKTDLEYEWPDPSRGERLLWMLVFPLLFTTLIPLLVLLVITSALRDQYAVPAKALQQLACRLVDLWESSVDSVCAYCTGKPAPDRAVWPFVRQEDLDEARKHPPYFRGNRL